MLDVFATRNLHSTASRRMQWLFAYWEVKDIGEKERERDRGMSKRNDERCGKKCVLIVERNAFQMRLVIIEQHAGGMHPPCWRHFHPRNDTRDYPGGARIDITDRRCAVRFRELAGRLPFVLFSRGTRVSTVPVQYGNAFASASVT